MELNLKFQHKVANNQSIDLLVATIHGSGKYI